MLETIIIGCILTWFNLDNLFVQAINQIFNTEYTTAIYWLLFLIIGLIVKIVKK